MQSYQSRYDSFLQLNATIIAVSADSEATAALFRDEVGADFSFIADSRGELIALYRLKWPLVTLAKRVTFVIGRGRRILHVDAGRRAVSSDGAAEACALF